MRVRLVTPLEEAERLGGGFITRRQMVRLHPSRPRCGRGRPSAQRAAPRIHRRRAGPRRASKTCRAGFDSSVACRLMISFGEDEILADAISLEKMRSSPSLDHRLGTLRSSSWGRAVA